MSVLNCALKLAEQKVRFFRVRPNSKLPAVKDFSNIATSNPEEIRTLFADNDFNSGIACGKVCDGLYIVGFDIDCKDGRNGYETLDLMEELGQVLPDTWTQKTPSGGEHRLFWSPVPIRQGTNVAGMGIDFRGDGGYLVGPDSGLDGHKYVVTRDLPIARFPDWAIKLWEKRNVVHILSRSNTKVRPAQNQALALKRSIEYLATLDTVVMGERANEAFKVACRLKDFGLEQSQIADVMGEHWKCEPFLEENEFLHTINSAFKYGTKEQGSDVPEFDAVDKEEEPPKPEKPEDTLNKDHFYVAFGKESKIYKESIGEDGRKRLDSWSVFVFHEKSQNDKVYVNEKLITRSKAWMENKKRREYDRLCFNPTGKTYKGMYNTWKGFAVSPAPIGKVYSPEAHDSVNLFIEHISQNICQGDKAHAQWVLGFFAHIFQHPEEKPGVAVVFKGAKGTGKTVVSEILNKLIGENSAIFSNKKHVLGDFNSPMEAKLLITLDEAFWSGDKHIEGILKDVITGRTRWITHKYGEPYKAEVFDRIVIIGNERWLVPATADERRYAVFKVSNKRRKDRDFFGRINDGLFEHGGAELLMKYFLSFDLTKVDVNVAPETVELNEQKENSLGVFEQWWKGCLLEGRILGAASPEWEYNIPAQEFYEAFIFQLDKEGVRAFKPSKKLVGSILKEILPSFVAKSKRVGNSISWTYFFSPLKKAREEWDEYMGFKTEWE